MIRPSQQWAAQIDITNACHLRCSNCTRLLLHAQKRFWMTPGEFEGAVKALARFPYDSEPCPQGRRKVVGVIGGEPLLHPQFPELVDIMLEHIPDVTVRGLWTSKHWKTDSHPKWGAYKPQVERLIGRRPTGNVKRPQHGCGFINHNTHEGKDASFHTPMLVAVKDVVPDASERWRLIRNCWVQREWSSSITPKGYYFCEVAAAREMVLGGDSGLSPIPGCWEGDLEFDEIGRPTGRFADQILSNCEDCGACVPMEARADYEGKDDVSPSNLVQIEEVGSPLLKRGNVVVHDQPAEYDPEAHANGEWKPYKYKRGKL